MRRVKILLVLAGITCLLLFHSFPRSLTREWNLRNASIHVLPQMFTGSFFSNDSQKEEISNQDVDTVVVKLHHDFYGDLLENNDSSLKPPVKENKTSGNDVTESYAPYPENPADLVFLLPSNTVEKYYKDSSQCTDGRNYSSFTDPVDILDSIRLYYRGKMQRWISEFHIQQLKSIFLIREPNVKRVIILSYFRAGSSFLGDLLQQHWKTFYNFEPLHVIDPVSNRVSDEEYEETAELLERLFSCQVTHFPDYTRWMYRKFVELKWNKFLMYFCEDRVSLCLIPEFVDAVCMRSTTHVAKINRLSMKHLERFLHNHPVISASTKVVYLVRDPRGIHNSRLAQQGWCYGECRNVSILCQEIEQDIEAFRRLKAQEPSKYHIVRFEELAKNPIGIAHQIYNFVGLPYKFFIREYIRSHTSKPTSLIENEDPFSTLRNSKKVVYQWKSKLSIEEQKHVQSSCLNVMHMLGYDTFGEFQVSSDRLPLSPLDPKTLSRMRKAVNQKKL